MMRDIIMGLISLAMLVFIAILMVISLDMTLEHEELKAEQYQKQIYLDSQD